jgi:hypothetical protein
MRQLVSLFEIAYGARNHEIIWRISATAHQWNNMINVILLAHLAIAVVAFTMLTFHLRNNIGCGMRAHSGMLASATPSINGTSPSGVFFLPTFKCFAHFIGMCFAVTLIRFTCLLWVSLCKETRIVASTRFTYSAQPILYTLI